MPNLHVISHTHWDREWYQPFQSFRLRLLHLVDGLLEILEKDPDYKFFMLDGQTIVLEDYLLLRPENETILREYIRMGRLLIGPWHILPDMFLVGPEAHIRNLHQGDRTARMFGQKMMIGYMPDSFGHIGQVPQILQSFGIEVACLWRGVKDGPMEFWWQAPDGSRVLMAYLREGYGNGADLPAGNLERFASQIAEKGRVLADHSRVSDLLIMQGTDHMEPSPHTSSAIAYADSVLPDTHVLHSTLPQYVSAIRAQIADQDIRLETLTGELRECHRMHLLPGVLSTRMWIKQRNHACETLLTRWAEPFTLFQENLCPNSQGTLDHKAGILRQAWHLLMENHPHDSICGCSIDQVHDEMKPRFDQVEQIGEELTRQSLEAITSAVDTSAGSPPQDPQRVSALVVFNPNSTCRTDVICTELELPASVAEFDLVGEDGTVIPFQEQGLGSHEIVNIVLDAKGLLSIFGNINDGQAAGMSIQEIQVERRGGQVNIEAIMAEGGTPNLVQWEGVRSQIDSFISDSSITQYHVHARSTSSSRIIASIQDVPGLGYQTIWIQPRPVHLAPPIQLNPLFKALLPLARLPFLQKLVSRKPKARGHFDIENDFFMVHGMKDGTFSITDKRTGMIHRGVNRFLDGGDCGDEYNYAPPAEDRIRTARMGKASIVRGSVQQSLKMELELFVPASLSPNRKSRSQQEVIIPISTTITLTQAVPRVDIHTTVENHARDHRLRVHFPSLFPAQSGFHDGHFEVVERAIGVPDFDETWVEAPRPEVPQRAFSTVSNGIHGLTIANRGLPEVEVMKNDAGHAEIALTLLRCTGWLSRDDFSTRRGHAGPAMETPGAQMQGTWSFDYSVIPHSGDWRQSIAQAYAFEVPLRTACTSIHVGKLPPNASLVKVEPAEFVVSALKQNEAGTGWLVRGYNITGEPLQVTIKPWKKFTEIQKVSLAEIQISALTPAPDGTVSLPARPHEILTIQFKD